MPQSNRKLYRPCYIPACRSRGGIKNNTSMSITNLRSAFIGDFYNNQPIGYLISKSLNFEKYIQITYLDQHLPHINFFETLGADSFFCR